VSRRNCRTRPCRSASGWVEREERHRCAAASNRAHPAASRRSASAAAPSRRPTHRCAWW
jgi:hypothetical protein